jgi:hypothetical protein
MAQFERGLKALQSLLVALDALDLHGNDEFSPDTSQPYPFEVRMVSCHD